MLSMRTYPSRPKNRALCVSGPELQLVEGQKTKWFANTQAGQREAMAYMEVCYEQAAEKKQWTDRNDTPLFGSPDEPGTFCHAFIEDETNRARTGYLALDEVDAKACALRQLGSLNYAGQKLRDVKIGDVTRGKVREDIVNQVRRMGSRSTVKRKWLYLKQLFAYAVEIERLNANPCLFAKDAKLFLNNEERVTDHLVNLDVDVPKILAAAPERYKLAMTFAAYTGLRAGEQLALTWDDIDLIYGTQNISVTKAVKKSGEVGAPKSKHGKRDVELPEHLADLLRHWKLKQSPKERQKHNLVFPTMHGDYADANTWRRRGLIPACKAAGVETIRWHDLRHYYASLLIFEIKHAPQEISRMMGHHDFSFTSKQYGHWLEKAKDKSKVGDKISALMGGM